MKSRGKSQDPYSHEGGCLRGYVSKVPGRVDRCTCGAESRATVVSVPLYILTDKTDQYYHNQMRGVFTSWEAAERERGARRSQLPEHAEHLVQVSLVESDRLLNHW